MNERIINFNYRKDNGELSSRQLYIVHEDSNYYTGFDFSYLNDAEKNVVQSVFDSKPITPPPIPGTTRINYMNLGVNKAIFIKSYRTFLKRNIVKYF